ncbi:aminopeptidase P N-terminal domain-containing protein [Sulfurimonas autotrophica]|uniref:Xaa-Pro aminopeptidase n=1 Tax=Sulfurimonas autotrophica (strain ATCC BAA-671 / DSM 16294 / JCM 11897 / OK10) TaxID=563040 RepID=E0UQ05_SULAO|nr:aminopeptidase P N-terminal domain-containing protein [Sulfurimonas autotrophica]ADN08680.1 peptidase M24 [Sulfurimonas autotrophica DSM 16294]
MISEKEYRKRRTRLGRKLKPFSVAVLFSASPKIRSNDTEFPYRQNSNFYYMSGFKEDNAALVFVKGAKNFHTYLFVAKKDKTQELWHGKRLGKDKAKALFMVDDVFEFDEFNTKLKEFVQNKHHIYYDFKLDYSKVKILKRHGKSIQSYENVASYIESMRLIKSKSEIKLINKALSITKKAHNKAMKISKKLQYEYQLQANIEYIFKKNGAYSDAYTSIVACGNSANTLHYINNDKKLIQGELILIDAGCEYEYYASDITRTIPVNVKFTQAQAEVYEMVLNVQKEIIKMIKPGILRSSLQKKSEELLCKGMIDLKILQGELKALIKEKAHKKYYPHGIGHWIGLDVHDECPYKKLNGKEIPLQPGMVMTIEPGIYLDEEDDNIPKKYRGIGIRIEDDILVTKNGCENLSCKIAKEIKDITRKSNSNR